MNNLFRVTMNKRGNNCSVTTGPISSEESSVKEEKQPFTTPEHKENKSTDKAQHEVQKASHSPSAGAAGNSPSTL